MNKIFIKIINSTLENGEIHIKKVAVFDAETGKLMRVAEITPELHTLFSSIEIDVTDFLSWMQMKRKNKNMQYLANSFNLSISPEEGQNL